MPAIILPRRFYSQPSGQVEIDVGNPFGAVAVWAAVPSSGVASKDGLASTLWTTLSVADSNTMRSGTIVAGLYRTAETAGNWSAYLHVEFSSGTWGSNLERVGLTSNGTSATVRASFLAHNSDATNAYGSLPGAGSYQHNAIVYDASVSGATADHYIDAVLSGSITKAGTFPWDTGNARNIFCGDSSLSIYATYAMALSVKLSAADLLDLKDCPWQVFKSAPRRLYFDLGGSYVLTAEAGSYALTGGAASFNTAMSASGGSYAATGGDAAFSTKLTASQGDYALSGGDAAFPITWSGEAGSYSLSGGDALFAINWIASGGSYTITGGDAVFQYGSGATLIGEAGDYVLTGGDATFKVTFVGAGESYALTGGEASFSAGLACGAGAYTYTGGAASFALNAVCGSGSYALIGVDTVFNIGFVAGEGAYTYAGGDATFNYSSGDIILTAEAGGYTLTGGDAQFVIGLAAGAGNYNWSGGDAAWAVNWVGASGSYVLAGGTANFVDSGNQSVAILLRTQSVYLRLVDGTYYLRLADPIE